LPQLHWQRKLCLPTARTTRWQWTSGMSQRALSVCDSVLNAWQPRQVLIGSGGDWTAIIGTFTLKRIAKIEMPLSQVRCYLEPVPIALVSSVDGGQHHDHGLANGDGVLSLRPERAPPSTPPLPRKRPHRRLGGRGGRRREADRIEKTRLGRAGSSRSWIAWGTTIFRRREP
jgi:hypothetical protein